MTLTGFVRSNGAVGARNHLLVLPTIVCATRVAETVASRRGGVTFVHQHGCGHIGDDIEHARKAFVGVAANPNVAATVVLSLGCETVQGRVVASDLAELRDRIAFVAIQDSGGAARAGEAAEDAAAGFFDELAGDVRSEIDVRQTVIGIACSREDNRAVALAALAVEEGARVVAAVDGAFGGWSDLDAALLGFGERADRGLSLLDRVGKSAQLHVALAAAGAAIIVAFRATDQPPIGFPISPVIAVASSSPLHAALRADFDLGGEAAAEQIWSSVLAVHDGALSAAEQRGSAEFALPRLRRTM